MTGHASWGGSSGSSNKANTRRASGSGGYGWRTSSTGKNGDGKGAEKAGRSAGSAGGQAAMKKHVCRNPYVHQVNVCSRGKSAVEVEERCRRRAWPLSIFARALHFACFDEACLHAAVERKRDRRKKPGDEAKDRPIWTHPRSLVLDRYGTDGGTVSIWSDQFGPCGSDGGVGFSTCILPLFLPFCPT